MKRFWAAIYRRWMQFARVLGRVQSTVLLILLYFLVVGPSNLILRLLRRDLLAKRPSAALSFWRETDQDLTIERSLRQF